ncbi:GNAT family N-acetyltransferase [Chryseobacterium sp. cx-311]|uniref:GNAT family N-acetyltransferase n=1 Tax=Marnyiella aurantia TaxID=2758037 RepID=UPI001AE93E61|nr:GNAT family N-acetyltransferase [Marnyiella aurantia]MBP0612384.1 GNAT family N-acetyltransferase [Marnyiella aurantia]
MSEIGVVEVKSGKELMEFIRFPMELYKNNKNYVPSLIKGEKENWDSRENPALNYSSTKKFLAKKDGKTVGRIALIINNKEKTELGISKVRFGWIDFIDDLNVSKSLIGEAEKFARENSISKIEGPMGFTNLDKAGTLTMGFDKMATMIGIYNHDYYSSHFEKLGLTKEKEWVEYEIVFPEILPEKVVKFNELIKEKYQLRVMRFKSKKEFLPLVDPMFKLLDQTYSSLSTYTPLTPEQIQSYKDKYFSLLDKDFIICVADKDDNLVAFAVTMPSYSEALQKANGYLFPFGWWHLLQAGKKNARANFYLIGIHPDYQKRGVTSIIFKEIYEIFKKKGVKYLETNPELADNKAIQLLWQDYNPVNHKRRATFSKTV